MRSAPGRPMCSVQLRQRRYRPRFYSEWNHASGDGNPHDGIRGCFDPLFGGPHDKLGLIDLFTWSNLVKWRSGIGLTLHPRILVGASYNSSWLAHARDWVYISGRPLVRRADGSAGTHIGHQADLQAARSATRSTQIQAGYGHLFPGDFLHHASASVPYNLVFLNISQRF